MVAVRNGVQAVVLAWRGAGLHCAAVNERGGLLADRLVHNNERRLFYFNNATTQRAASDPILRFRSLDIVYERFADLLSG